MPLKRSEASFEGTSVKSSSMLPVSPTSLGNLGFLPREIRNEIYGDVFGLSRSSEWLYTPHAHTPMRVWLRSCDAIITPQSDRFDNGRCIYVDGVRRSILCISRDIRQEAMEVLCSEGVFDVDTLPYREPNTSIVHPIMNVRLDSELTPDELLKGASLFVGSEVLRKAFVMHLEYAYWVSTQIMTPSLIEVAKQLTGFRTVVFKILPNFAWINTFMDMGDDETWLDADSDTEFNALIPAFRQALEPTLGPGTEQILGQKLRLEVTRHNVAVIFHPQDYLSGKLRIGDEGGSRHAER